MKQGLFKREPARTSFIQIDNKESQVVVRELGFANICMGLLGLFSLFYVQFRLPAAIVGGLYFGLAGMLHIIKKPVSQNEKIALTSDMFIFIIMLVFVFSTISK